MRHAGLLLLAILFAMPLIAAGPAEQPGVPPDQSAGASDLIMLSPPSADFASTLVLPERFGQGAFDSSDSICYKIRAYIFKQDDDHTPELKGSTTCGPRQARAKEVAWPKARLVPAK